MIRNAVLGMRFAAEIPFLAVGAVGVAIFAAGCFICGLVDDETEYAKKLKGKRTEYAKKLKGKRYEARVLESGGLGE